MIFDDAAFSLWYDSFRLGERLMMYYAVVDIGTNSVRLMVAHIKGKRVIADYKTLRLVRVGEGMTKEREIATAAMIRAADALNEFLTISQSYRVDKLFCFATSAVRDAQNSAEFLSHVRGACGLEMDIISGEQEALLGFAGCIDDKGGMFDIGGGSTEVMLGSLKDISFQKSYDIGTVRCLQMFPGADEADPRAFFAAHELAAHTFAAVPKQDVFAYTGIGGTATALAAIDLGLRQYDARRIQGHVLSLEKAEAICAMLKSKTKAQRRQLMGLEENKADVIVFGAILFVEFLKAAGAAASAISDSDNLEGYLKFRLGLV
jgi:exopolyphosphatase/guanosine-5'-triphosphate,3'-diphosphate pyrophosphatase